MGQLMHDRIKIGLEYRRRCLCTPFICLSFLIFSFIFLSSPDVHAQANVQCTRNNIGDVICPASGGTTYGSSAAPVISSPFGAGSLGPGSPIFSAFGGAGSSVSGLLGSLNGLLSSLQQPLQGALMLQVLNTLNGGANAPTMNDILTSFQNVQSALDSFQVSSCGGTSVNGDYLAYAQNAAAQIMSTSQNLSSITSASITSQICSNLTNVSGGLLGGGSGGLVPGSSGQITQGGGGTIAAGGTQLSGIPPVDGATTQGQRIAECAVNAIGMSTADNPLTQGGALGCALAVSRILDCASYGVGEWVGTGSLYSALNNDPCYTIVDTGHITSADAMNLEPGDVLVTQRGSRAGHTGIYIGNGDIISNSSSGFNGSAMGTVQQNYTVDAWYGVTSRNPGGSAVFRRTCP